MYNYPEHCYTPYDMINWCNINNIPSSSNLPEHCEVVFDMLNEYYYNISPIISYSCGPCTAEDSYVCLITAHIFTSEHTDIDFNGSTVYWIINRYDEAEPYTTIEHIPTDYTITNCTVELDNDITELNIYITINNTDIQLTTRDIFNLATIYEGGYINNCTRHIDGLVIEQNIPNWGGDDYTIKYKDLKRYISDMVWEYNYDEFDNDTDKYQDEFDNHYDMYKDCIMDNLEEFFIGKKVKIFGNQLVWR